MSYLPKTRKFDGQLYRLHGEYLKRNTAEWEATKLRGSKWKTRIVQIVLFGVYKRR